MRVKKPFSVFKRKLPSGKPSFSYYAYRPDGTRMTPRSTGQRTKAAAERYCNELYRKGELIPKTLISFKEYTEDWWVYEKCAYVQRKLRTRNRFSPSHAASQRANLLRYIKPTFDRMHLSEIRTGDIERWRASLIDVHHLSQLTANHVLATLKVILHEATRRQDILFDPSASVERYAVDSREKGILTIAEARSLFAPEALESIWSGDEDHYAINMVAMLGGLRQSEILTLKAGDLREDGVEVCTSWDRKTKSLVLPKNGKKRFVPLARPALDLLQKIAARAPQTEEGYLFPNARLTGPIDHKVVNDRFSAALAKIGVEAGSDKPRNITFHSWRHYANTQLRTFVGDLIARSMIGHADVEMQDHYTHTKDEDRKRIIAAQLELLGRVA
jgi:integrase